MSIALLTAFLDPSNASDRSSIGLDPGTREPLMSTSPERRSSDRNIIFEFDTITKFKSVAPYPLKTPGVKDSVLYMDYVMF